MRAHSDRSKLAEAVRSALMASNTTQETLASACEIPLARIKAFLAGEVRVSRGEWERMRGALGLSVRQAKQATK